MVDIPERTESHGPVFIYGVEGEQIEEENDAYNDLRYDIGQFQSAQTVVYVWCLCNIQQLSFCGIIEHQ